MRISMARLYSNTYREMKNEKSGVKRKQICTGVAKMQRDWTVVAPDLESKIRISILLWTKSRRK